MRYRVEYVTDTKPTDLPSGAKVEEISLLPAKVVSTSSFGKSIDVEKSELNGQASFLWVETPARAVSIHLDRDGTLKLIEALKEIVNNGLPFRVRDNDGDVWQRRENNLYTINYNRVNRGDPSWIRMPYGVDKTLDHIREHFGPIAVIED